ncbi:hypothetical protein [Actinoplanes siamensis]|uniref:hypothetical protein n=1 Tax=Actinoplanes siamensis TaxID=1223317 RepID=UPI001EF301B5|nr:hypothetical protein [Actinoplanes siamensis]
MKVVAATCDAPALVVLTGDGDSVTGETVAVPGGPLTADTAPAALAAVAALIGRHPVLFPADVYGYAVILPGERAAFAADRCGITHHILLPGINTEPVRPDRWGAITDGLTAMINAAH